MPKSRTTPCSLTGSCRSPRKSMGLPYVGRSCNRACCALFDALAECQFSSAAVHSLGSRTGRSATTSAHSGLLSANLRKTSGSMDQGPKRLSSVRGSCFPSSRYSRRERRTRFLRTVSPQSLSSSLSSGRTFNLRGSSPAALTASFHLEKNCETEYLVIPEREKNSECDGERPSRLATAPIESKICCLSDIDSLLWSVV